jgi:fucose permease
MAQYIPFLDNANRLFQKRFCFTQTSAGEVVTITYIATALVSGPLGILVNKVGYRRYFIMLATLVFFTAHTILWAYPQCEGSP